MKNYTPNGALRSLAPDGIWLYPLVYWHVGKENEARSGKWNMPRKMSEERTRKDMIDPQLEHAGWYLRDHSKVKIEIPEDGYDAEPWNGVTNYTLYRENWEVSAVVEAKKTIVDVRLTQAQLNYFDKIQRSIYNKFSEELEYLYAVK